MSESSPLPFQSFTFSLVQDRRPRAALRMTVLDDGMYELHVQKGSAANPAMQFTRAVPVESAQRLKDALQEIGVFGWDEAYGDDPARPAMRWSANTVFKEGVFSVASKGGSAVPPGFDAMLEELYRLDFPRPESGAVDPGGRSVPPGSMAGAFGASGLRGMGSLSAGDLGAYGAVGGGFGAASGGGVDFSQIADLLGASGMPGLDASEMNSLLAEAGSNPQALQHRMRDEFAHMSPDGQARMLDALAATGLASRAWWERFFRGMQ